MNNKTKKANQGWWYRWVPYVKLQSLPSRIFIHQDIHFYTILNWSFFPLKFLTPSRTQHSALGTALPNLHQCSRGCDRVPIWCPPPFEGASTPCHKGCHGPYLNRIILPINTYVLWGPWYMHIYLSFYICLFIAILSQYLVDLVWI